MKYDGITSSSLSRDFTSRLSLVIMQACNDRFDSSLSHYSTHFSIQSHSRSRSRWYNAFNIARIQSLMINSRKKERSCSRIIHSCMCESHSVLICCLIMLIRRACILSPEIPHMDCFANAMAFEREEMDLAVLVLRFVHTHAYCCPRYRLVRKEEVCVGRHREKCKVMLAALG